MSRLSKFPCFDKIVISDEIVLICKNTTETILHDLENFSVLGKWAKFQTKVNDWIKLSGTLGDLYRRVRGLCFIQETAHACIICSWESWHTWRCVYSPLTPVGPFTDWLKWQNSLPFHNYLSYKTWCTVYMRNRDLARLARPT